MKTLLLLFLLAILSTNATTYFFGSAAGQFSLASSWVGAILPVFNSSNDIVINSTTAFNATVDISVTINSITIGNSLLSNSLGLVVSSALSVNTLTIMAGANVYISGTIKPSSNANAVINNYGNIYFSSGAAPSNVVVNNYATTSLITNIVSLSNCNYTNTPTGTFLIAGSFSINGGSFINNGVINATGAATLGSAGNGYGTLMYNYGSINTKNQSFTVQNVIFENRGSISGGDVTFSSTTLRNYNAIGSVIMTSSSNIELQAGSAINSLVVDTSNAKVFASSTISTIVLKTSSNSNLIFQGAYTITSQSFTLSRGTVDSIVDPTKSVPSNGDRSNYYPGVITVASTFVWDQGNIQSNTQVNALQGCKVSNIYSNADSKNIIYSSSVVIAGQFDMLVQDAIKVNQFAQFIIDTTGVFNCSAPRCGFEGNAYNNNNFTNKGKIISSNSSYYVAVKALNFNNKGIVDAYSLAAEYQSADSAYIFLMDGSSYPNSNLVTTIGQNCYIALENGNVNVPNVVLNQGSIIASPLGGKIGNLTMINTATCKSPQIVVGSYVPGIVDVMTNFSFVSGYIQDNCTINVNGEGVLVSTPNSGYLSKGFIRVLGRLHALNGLSINGGGALIVGLTGELIIENYVLFYTNAIYYTFPLYALIRNAGKITVKATFDVQQNFEQCVSGVINFVVYPNGSVPTMNLLSTGANRVSGKIYVSGVATIKNNTDLVIINGQVTSLFGFDSKVLGDYPITSLLCYSNTNVILRTSANIIGCTLVPTGSNNLPWDCDGNFNAGNTNLFPGSSGNPPSSGATGTKPASSGAPSSGATGSNPPSSGAGSKVATSSGSPSPSPSSSSAISNYFISMVLLVLFLVQ